MYIDFSLKSTNRDLWRLEYVSFYSNHTIQYSVYYKLLSMVLFSMAPIFIILDDGNPSVGLTYVWTAAASGIECSMDFV